MLQELFPFRYLKIHRLTIMQWVKVFHCCNCTHNLEEISLEPDVEYHGSLAFRKVDQQDLVGAVSVVDGPELLRKSYTSNPLDGINTLIGGFNGNSHLGKEGY
jgi:hypothetical protein